MASFFSLATVAKRGIPKAPLILIKSTSDYATSEAIELYPKVAREVKTRGLDCWICQAMGNLVLLPLITWR